MGDYYSAKEKAIAIAPKFTSLMSMMGSGYIIWDVLIHSNKVKKSTQHRILLGMSTCDFIVSTTFFFTTWPIPAGTNVYAASGNQATCTAQGFLSQFSLAVAMYNAALTFFYVAKIRWNWTAQRIARRLEPFLHIIPLMIGLGTSFVGIALDLYNNDSWECWIAPLPQNCNESWKSGGQTNCIRGDNASLYRWVLYYAVLWLAILLVTVNMSLVYFSVLAKEKAMDRYTFGLDTNNPTTHHNTTAAAGAATPSGTAATTSRNTKKTTNVEENSGATNATAATTATTSTDPQQQQKQQRGHVHFARMVRFPTRVYLGNSGGDCDGGGGGSTSSTGWNQGTTTGSSGLNQGANSTSSSGLYSQPHESRQRHLRHTNTTRLRRHSKRVANQGYWYCGAFYSTWFFPTITRLVQVIPPGRTPYPLILITAMFVPIQGFFNFLVYSRPQWEKWRKERKRGRQQQGQLRSTQSQPGHHHHHRGASSTASQSYAAHRQHSQTLSSVVGEVVSSHVRSYRFRKSRNNAPLSCASVVAQNGSKVQGESVMEEEEEPQQQPQQHDPPRISSTPPSPVPSSSSPPPGRTVSFAQEKGQEDAAGGPVVVVDNTTNGDDCHPCPPPLPPPLGNDDHNNNDGPTATTSATTDVRVIVDD